MQKIKLQIHMTIDGFITGQNGEMIYKPFKK